MVTTSVPPMASLPASHGEARSDTHPSEGVGPVSTLRGAKVQADPRRAGRVMLAVVFLALVALAAVLLAEAVASNARIGDLKRNGAPVSVTVTSCLANGTGTGSTYSGYTCRGSFTVSGRRHVEVINGVTGFLATGTTLPGVTEPSDPGYLATARSVDDSQPSFGVFVGPVVLGTLALLLGAGALWQARRRRPARS